MPAFIDTGASACRKSKYLSRTPQPMIRSSKSIKAAIAAARSFIVVLSRDTVNSRWVRKEIDHALAVEQERKDDGYRIIPLLLPGMRSAALGMWFDEKPTAVSIEPEPGGLAASMPAIMAALGEELLEDAQPLQEVPPPPIDDLILELEDPTIVEKKGTFRARATATLVYEPAGSTRRAVRSRRYSFSAPLGPIELEEIRWYLEEYYLWPVGVFSERAARTAANLPVWGQALYEAALAGGEAQEALRAWQNLAGGSARRFSVWVDRDPPKGARKERVQKSHAAATELLALPWELLHDEGDFLLHGANPARIRRRLPNRIPRDVAVAELPIRILLLSPRPELDEEGEHPVGYIDHRASALPLVQAVENLGDLASLTVLQPPTLAALEDELSRAKKGGRAV
jgi:hypothetical protein